MENFPKDYLDLLKDETKAFVILATLMPDGTPQATPVWFNSDNEHILINTSVGRVKDKNMKKRPNVALVIHDHKNPGRYIQIRGVVASSSIDGSNEHINVLSLKYTGKSWKPYAGQTRICYRIKPVHFDAH